MTVPDGILSLIYPMLPIHPIVPIPDTPGFIF